jgi:hypothetical protein
MTRCVLGTQLVRQCSQGYLSIHLSQKKTDAVGRSRTCEGTRHAVMIELEWGTRVIREDVVKYPDPMGLQLHKAGDEVYNVGIIAMIQRTSVSSIDACDVFFFFFPNKTLYLGLTGYKANLC